MIGEKNEIIKSIKPFNYGLGILKSLLAFSVVTVHNFNPRTTRNKLILIITKNRKLHVPSFFIMSFYFLSSKLFALNISLLIKRLSRLFIPYILWPIIVWEINHILNVKYHTNFPDAYNILKLQLLWGSKYMFQFWFQWNIIAITLLFALIISVFGNNSIFFLLLLFILSYIAQYSGFYLKYIYLKYPNYNRCTISRIFEMIPFGVTGLLFGYYKIINNFKKRKIKVLIIALVAYFSIQNYNIFTNINGVTYYGINLNIMSVCIICIFSLFPSDKIKNKYLIKILILLTNNSSGVYYLHLTIHNYFRFFIDAIKKSTFFGVIINYLICYFICYFGLLVFGKTPFKYLFC